MKKLVNEGSDLFRVFGTHYWKQHWSITTLGALYFASILLLLVAIKTKN